MISEYAKHALSNLWRWKTGKQELETKTNKIRQTRQEIENMMCPFLNQLCSLPGIEFENLMINRIHMGQFRYGPASRNNKYDYLSYAFEVKYPLWKVTGNDEMLVDIANLCWLEYFNDSGKIHPILKETMRKSFLNKKKALIRLAFEAGTEFHYGKHPKKHFKSDSSETNKSKKLNV